jgi:tetratricopeptide (TPR) repeat protein
MTIDPLDFALKADSTYKFMNVGRIQEAELLADAILDHNPDSVLGLSSKGNIYWRTGRTTQAFRTYHRLLQINPNTAHILARIARSYLELGDPESAWRWLERAAEINPEGLHAEKARYCRMTGDLACAKENYQLALAWADEEERQVNLKADIAALEKDWPTALENLNRRIRLALDRGSSFGPTVERLTAAWVADKMGLVERRDEYLGLAIADTRVGIENGSRAQYIWWLYADAYAIKGDAARTHENLALAIERGFRNLPYVLHTGYYDKVLNDPKIVELLEQLKADNWRELQSLQAAEAELEGGLGI